MIFFELACHKKNEKCSNGPYIYDVHTEQRWEVLKVVVCSWILLFLNNRFIVDSYRWRGWKGHKTNVFLWVSHTWNISFQLEMKMLSYLRAEHISFYLLIFEFPFIMTEIVLFFGKGTSVVFRASNLFQIHNHIQDGEFKVLLKLVAHCYKFS